MDTPNQDGSTTPAPKQSTSETGHAVNVAGLDKVMKILKRHGDKYAPSTTGLTLKWLEVLYADAKKAIDDCEIAETNFDNATNERALLFKQLYTLSMKAANNFRSTGVSNLAIDDANAVIRKLQGKPSNLKKKDVLSGIGEASDSISSSQRSYVQQVEHFSKLKNILASHPEYAPNEVEIQIPALNKFQNELEGSNENINAAISDWSGARMRRNTILYTPETGLVDTALRIKKYVAATFGNTSNEFKEINKISFRNVGLN